MEEYLSPTETARRLGTTVKALKVYERLGLVRPTRTGAGWRLYGPAQILRLHEVLALKGLGLSLAQIGVTLAGRTTDLDRTLAVQEIALRARRRDIDRVLNRVRQVRARLAAGEALSAAELIAVARDTTETPSHWGERMADYYRRHLGEGGWPGWRQATPTSGGS
jgi:DNA-binding transcriptional MerR regulator